MRRISKKTAVRIAEATEFRRALVSEVQHCEICGHAPGRVGPGRVAWALHVHEIARGKHRNKALDKRFAVLVVCFRCHMEQLDSREQWPEARQLAVLKRSRPADYNLEAYNELVGHGSERITEADVFASTARGTEG